MDEEGAPVSGTHARLVEEMKAHMAAHGLSQSAAGARAGLNPGVVSMWFGRAATRLAPPTEAKVDVQIANYLASPGVTSAAAATATETEAPSSKADRPPAEQAEHARLVERLEAHMATHGVSQAAVARSVGGRWRCAIALDFSGNRLQPTG